MIRRLLRRELGQFYGLRALACGSVIVIACACGGGVGALLLLPLALGFVSLDE